MPEAHLALCQGPDVSVVVPVYNGASCVAVCIESLLALRGLATAPEIIIVDNESTDGTVAILQSFGDRIRVLRETTRGASAARNTGIRAARGRVVAFIDVDCVVEPDWLAALIEPLENPAVGMTGGAVLSRPGANRIERFGETIHDHRRAIETEDPPYVMTGNCASRREVLLEAGLFDTSLLRGQDVDLAWRIHRAGRRLAYVANAVVRHRNERTLWGLAREGYVHGLHGVRLGHKHAGAWPGTRRSLGRARTRIFRAIRRTVQARDPIDGFLALMFDASKSAGEIVALTRG